MGVVVVGEDLVVLVVVVRCVALSEGGALDTDTVCVAPEDPHPLVANSDRRRHGEQQRRRPVSLAL